MLDELKNENQATITWPQTTYVPKTAKEIAVKQVGAEALPQTYPATRPLTAPPVKLDNTAAIPKTTKNPSYVNAVVMKSSTHELGDNKAAMAERAWHSDIGRKETMMPH